MSIELPHIKEAREQSRIPTESLIAYRALIAEAVKTAILDHKVVASVPLTGVAETPRVINRLIDEVEYRVIKKGDEKTRKKTGYRAYVLSDGVTDAAEPNKKNVTLTIEWGKPSEMTLELHPVLPVFFVEEDFGEPEDDDSSSD